MPLAQFHPIISQWFRGRFEFPTDVQAKSWPVIQSGRDVLIAAPTGSGKTLAAFLSCINTLFHQALAGELEDRTRVLYVSPLKALSNDVQKNLQQPLAEIGDAALAAGFLMPDLRVTVRTGDTPVWDRQHMLKRPPHILITTPESLYLLLTAEKSRKILADVRTVIVDEIHAVASNKRGAHLALSLERLDALTPSPPVRIGLSATQRPIETVAQFLVGRRSLPQIVDIGHRREMDIAVEVPKDELGAVATNAVWSDFYDRLADLVREHRSTLIFVNTRRLAERVSHYLAERLQDTLGPQAVAAHHGSLSRQIRLSAEERLKRGETRVVVATASLELGIDVGTVDLVCQIGSPRAIAVCLQRIGRSGHWIGAKPKGRLFATTRDELIECAALIRAIRTGALDRLDVPPAPLDILAQQIVAAAATQEWQEDDLYALCRRAFPYRSLERKAFDAVVRMQADGITTGRGRGRAYLHHDRINRRIRGRRGARLAAITSGGAIPDTANYAVIAEPDGTVVGSVDEDFAVESLAGDIILLGNSSWKVRGVETGRMRVEDARGAPPTIPFWRGEAPSRTAELSAEVALMRAHLDELIRRGQEEGHVQDHALHWLQTECGLDRRGAEQAVAYVVAGRAALGEVPTHETIVAERFFDEGGGMQLILHAPFGGRLNRAWGLALRKRFCTTFDFELQAAATDEGIVISLGERHSFPLQTIFGFLRSDTVRDVLIQAILAAPMFISRWRWNAGRALALLRFVNGKRVAPQIQRMRAEDLLGAVFPAATACQDNHPKGKGASMGKEPVLAGSGRAGEMGKEPVLAGSGRAGEMRKEPVLAGSGRAGEMGAGGGVEIDMAHNHLEIPDHPLVSETIRDCLTEAMDIEGLTALLQRIEQGRIRCVSIDTPTPSPFCHEILNANPYAYLDDAPLEERRARAVEMRRTLPLELAGNLGALDADAIAEVEGEAWPVACTPDELHDALLTLIWLPEGMGKRWQVYLPPLIQTGRAIVVTLRDGGVGEFRGWAAVERLALVRAVFPNGVYSSAPVDVEQNASPERGDAIHAMVQGWMESTGPTTAEELAQTLYLPIDDVSVAFLRLEAAGQVLRGRFRAQGVQGRGGDHHVEWCDRRLLARIHRLTIGRLRKEVEPVTAAEFMRFLFQWQHVTPGARLHGEAGLHEIIRQLAGFEAAASVWERAVLSVRLAKYDPELLDRLCLNGSIMWGRLTLHPRLAWQDGKVPVSIGAGQASENKQEGQPDLDRVRRIVPTSVAPISFFPREDAEWLMALSADEPRTVHEAFAALSPVAQDLRRYLHERGASFFADLMRGTNHLQAEIESGLWGLAAAGLVTADGFDSLRALLDPRRRRAQGRERMRRPRHGAGRWSLLRPQGDGSPRMGTPAMESVARLLLHRYGVVFRDLLGRESLNVAWRDLLVQYRKMESRGEIRGGRFVSGFTGDQFALPEAVESLRTMRRSGGDGKLPHEIRISGSDPLNLVGIIIPGIRVPAVPSNYVVFKDGMFLRTGASSDLKPPESPQNKEKQTNQTARV